MSENIQRVPATPVGTSMLIIKQEYMYTALHRVIDTTICRLLHPTDVVGTISMIQMMTIKVFGGPSKVFIPTAGGVSEMPCKVKYMYNDVSERACQK
eukprot:1365676-Amorphochlora_amoeboformis.AAC.2